MSLVFRVQWQLHLALRYLTEALSQERASSLHTEVQAMIDDVTKLTFADAQTLQEVDVLAHKQELHALLWRVSEAVRADQTSDERGS